MVRRSMNEWGAQYDVSAIPHVMKGRERPAVAKVLTIDTVVAGVSPLNVHVAPSVTDRMEADILRYVGTEIQSFHHTHRSKDWERTKGEDTPGILRHPLRHKRWFQSDDPSTGQTTKEMFAMLLGVFDWPGVDCMFFVALRPSTRNDDIVVYAAHPTGAACLRSASRADIERFGDTVDRVAEGALKWVLGRPIHAVFTLANAVVKRLGRKRERSEDGDAAGSRRDNRTLRSSGV